MRNKLIIFGGTGLIGKEIVKNNITDFKKIIVVSRSILNGNIFSDYKSVELISYSEKNIISICDNSDVMINLSGASIAGKRWNAEYKNLLYDSRIDTVRQIKTILNKLHKRPGVFINASAIGIYGNRFGEEVNEDSNPGNDFLAILCRDWEKEVNEISELNIRVVNLRIGIVLSNTGGALEKLILPYKYFIGGYIASGKQYISWIHIDDLVNIVKYVSDNDFIGPVNCSSPEPVTNKEFNKTLSKILKRPMLFRIPSFSLKLIFGEFANQLINGQKVIPGKLISQKYNFIFPSLENALNNLLNKNA